MPTYHYRCKNCSYDFTAHQSFEDDPITVCPECGQEQVRKIYSAVPIEFKGSGFYRTDGALAGTVSLAEGENFYPLPSGIYIVKNTKVAVP